MPNIRRNRLRTTRYDWAAVRCSDAFGDLVVYGLSARMDAPSGVGIGAFLFFRRPYRREPVPYEKG